MPPLVLAHLHALRRRRSEVAEPAARTRTVKPTDLRRPLSPSSAPARARLLRGSDCACGSSSSSLVGVRNLLGDDGLAPRTADDGGSATVELGVDTGEAVGERRLRAADASSAFCALALPLKLLRLLPVLLVPLVLLLLPTLRLTSLLVLARAAAADDDARRRGVVVVAPLSTSASLSSPLRSALSSSR